MRWVAYRQVKQAITEYEALDDDIKAGITFEDWLYAESADVKDYARNQDVLDDIGVDLEQWKQADDRDRAKFKRMAERKAKMEQQLKHKAG